HPARGAGDRPGRPPGPARPVACPPGCLRRTGDRSLQSAPAFLTPEARRQASRERERPEMGAWRDGCPRVGNGQRAAAVFDPFPEQEGRRDAPFRTRAPRNDVMRSLPLRMSGFIRAGLKLTLGLALLALGLALVSGPAPAQGPDKGKVKTGLILN